MTSANTLSQPCRRLRQCPETSSHSSLPPWSVGIAQTFSKTRALTAATNCTKPWQVT